MRLAGIDDVDIAIDLNGQPIVDPNGSVRLVSGRSCWMQDIWCEMQCDEGELLHEDEEGRMAYGFSYTDYLSSDEEQREEFQARTIEKLSKREYIDDGSIQIVSFEELHDGLQAHVIFKQVDSDEEINIDIQTGVEVTVR